MDPVSSPSSTITNLKNLKSKLDGRQMSVLVGAGFGKNIHNMFPSWWELLFDMAYFLHGRVIEEAYLNIPIKKRTDKKKYIDNAINDFIEKVGYLDLVTHYITRKGFQESISTYIEEKTPKVVRKSGKRYIVNRVRDVENEVELLDSMLDLHTSLISLPWNNIYTTNYDEMLELSNDKTNEEKLLSIQKIIECKNKELYIELDKFNKLKRDQEDLLTLLEEKENAGNVINNPVLTSNTVMQSSTSEIEEKRNQLKHIEYDLISVESTIKQNDIELLKVQKEIEKCLKTIVNSSDLAIKRNRNIIKLHGSIRKDTDNYGFDNDIRSHYIISREDYDLYPQKHEAFTQLMRISLLQESYCLIGFSGVDPNFLEWIKWVRDVLERNRGAHKNYKIYLIEVSQNKAEDEKELFYENFRICKIALDDDSLIQFMQDETGLKLDNKIDRKKALLSLLFSYLKEENFETPNLFIQQYNLSRYTDEWNSIRTFDLNITTTNIIIEKVEALLQHYDTIVENRNCSRIKLNNFVFARNKMDLLQVSIKLLDDLKNDFLNQKKILDLILIAIDDLMLPLSGFWNPDEILILEDLLSTDEDRDKFNSFKLRGSLLYNDKNEFFTITEKLEHKINIVEFEKSLFYAFSFDFKNMKLHLDAWHPNEAQYILKKSGLLALLDPNLAEEYLSASKSIFENSNVEELLFYYQTILYFDSEKDYITRKKISSYISILDSKGFKGVYKHFNNILDDLKIKPERIDRYGSGRFSFSNEIIMTKDLTREGKSIQFIQLLIELGLPLKVGNFTLKSAEDWYEVCKNIFEEFPVPCLFYSLQYSTEKVIRRIGQDYAYSDQLDNFNKEILPKLLTKYLSDDLPWRFKKSILYFCSELFVAVNPELWEGKFLLIWKNFQFQEQSFDSRRNEEYIFISEGLKIIRKTTTFNNIILSCLTNFKKNNAIDFLYYIANNEAFKYVNIQNSTISKKINQLILQIGENENLVFVFGNLNLKLTPSQLTQVKGKLIKINFKEIKNPSAWQILFYFFKEDSVTKFKKGLLNSGLLFNTGFNSDKSLSMGHNYVSLSFVNNHKIWTKAEGKLIYKILLLELDKIEKWMLKRTDTNFDFMFKEMLSFLEAESFLLNGIKGYVDVKDKINSYLYAEKGYSTFTEAIISDDKTKILTALSDMSELIKDRKISVEISEAIQLLLTRILFQNQIALEATINYIAIWIEEQTNKDIFIPFKNLLKLIFVKYSESYPQNIAIPFIQKQLIIIITSYLKYYDNDVDVLQQLDIFKKKEFFN